MFKKIVVIGECMIEFFEKGVDVKCGFGGDILNIFVYIVCQVDFVVLIVYYVMVLGMDSFSQQMLDVWYGENVDIFLI